MRIATGTWIAVGALVCVALVHGPRTTSADGEEKTLVERVADLERSARAAEPKLADFERRLTALEMPTRVISERRVNQPQETLIALVTAFEDRLRDVETFVRETTSRGIATSAELISAAVLAYAAETHKLPVSLDDLANSSPTTGLPYLRHVPRDPWGEPFVYRVLDPATRLFQIVSAGPDKTLGTKDDVAVPKQAK